MNIVQNKELIEQYINYGCYGSNLLDEFHKPMMITSNIIHDDLSNSYALKILQKLTNQYFLLNVETLKITYKFNKRLLKGKPLKYQTLTKYIELIDKSKTVLTESNVKIEKLIKPEPTPKIIKKVHPINCNNWLNDIIELKYKQNIKTPLKITEQRKIKEMIKRRV